ncbi:hypothetical protein FOC4_g10009852 [Fusarium odoratissimum]|uniref:Heterokaryon incompatibility domain-containing protein n=2 Tax=Fusarium oxysporum species complex TaxID=171631 RepID=N1RXM4_FUSC4|nr:hypothetical protein FOC4_g10009852 [Fusarium odoratissimum]TXC02922.1 hypothetical protein FocTR4_00015365 [Fusarium oxysporum f. sp. cubense]
MFADKDKTSRSGKSADACPVSLPSSDFAFFSQHPYFSGNKLSMDENAKLNRHQALSSSDSIRILHLRPGSGSETIRFSLEEVLLGETDGRYEAASYVWGCPDITTTAIRDEKPLRVTTNLAFGLRAFRLRDASQSLWVDAVCIN